MAQKSRAEAAGAWVGREKRTSAGTPPTTRRRSALVCGGSNHTLTFAVAGPAGMAPEQPLHFVDHLAGLKVTDQYQDTRCWGRSRAVVVVEIISSDRLAGHTSNRWFRDRRCAP